ncbi:hypothetical protein L3V82_04330 [Thiotrichales bacterium 19S3-7]|nr:hypothetical protein [Thiotrichales bacterium 19S3-7]MCF6801321.1 hypothetical protein [Thiotrichales bacterium 19S3-11]
MTNISHLTSETLIKVQGIDSEKFLQGQLTQDIQLLTQQTNLFSAYCNAKGRIISLFQVFKTNEAIYLSLAKSTANSMLEIIQKYALFSKVTLSVSDDYYTYAAWGEAIEHFISQNTSSINLRIKTSKTSYKLFTKSPIATDNTDVNYLSESQWQAFLISSKYPVILAENSEHFLPAELKLNQLDAISLSKGCYVGQEVIARMHYLGQTKKTLYYAVTTTKLDGIQLKAKIFNQKQKAVGEVVNYAFNEDKSQTELLVLMNQSAIADETNNTFTLNDNPITLIH